MKISYRLTSAVVYVLLLSALISLGGLARRLNAQNAGAANPFASVRVAKTFVALSSSSISDEGARRLVLQVVTNSGGLQAWRSVRSARTDFAEPSPQGAPKRHMMMDDWSTDTVRYSRAFGGDQSSAVNRDGIPSYKVADKHGQHTLPEYDQARILVDHLPAAAAEIMLRHAEYIFKNVDTGQCPEGFSCIDVYRQPQTNAAFVREQEWVVSNTTTMPVTIFINLPNPMNQATQWKRVDFDNFTTIGSLTVPNSISTSYPGGMRHRRTLTSLRINAPYDKVSFNVEVGR
jgi:hypothetical protein